MDTRTSGMEEDMDKVHEIRSACDGNDDDGDDVDHDDGYLWY